MGFLAVEWFCQAGLRLVRESVHGMQFTLVYGLRRKGAEIAIAGYAKQMVIVSRL